MKRVPFVEIDGGAYGAWWLERFAPADDPFEGMRFYQRGRANIWVGTADIRGLESARTDAIGVHLLRIGRRIWKPTSAAMVSFGATARRNAIEMEGSEALRFLAGDPVPLAVEDGRRAELSRGFVVVRFNGAPLGCGEWHERGVIESCIPKGRRLTDIDM